MGRRDSYGSRDIGAWLVRHGWALGHARYSGGTYATQQSQARSERRDMWQSEFEAPWEWRGDLVLADAELQ